MTMHQLAETSGPIRFVACCETYAYQFEVIHSSIKPCDQKSLPYDSIGISKYGNVLKYYRVLDRT